MPRHYIAVDTETKDVRNPGGTSTHILWHWHAVSWTLRRGKVGSQQEYVGTFADEFWTWLYSRLDPRATTWLCAHFAAYDLTALRIWDEMAAGRLRLRRVARGAHARDVAQGVRPPPPALCCTHDPPTVIDLMAPGLGRLTLLDTMNWFPMPLKEVARSFGVAVPPDLGDAASDEDWRNKCALDARAVQAAVVGACRWVKENDLGNMRYTAAGQGLQAFRHGRMDCEITTGHAKEVKALERESYYPGLLRAFYLGVVERADTRPFREAAHAGNLVPVEYTGPVYRLDVNAAYPAAMRTADFPVAYQEWILGPSVRLTDKLLEQYEGCASVTIDSPRCAYPVRDGHKVRWCYGLFQTVLCGPDLRAAIARGHVARVAELHLHKRGRPFQSVCSYFLAMRKRYAEEGNAALALATKTAINSLHGKFLQWGGGWEASDEYREALPFDQWPEFDASGQGGRLFRMLGCDLQVNHGRVERDDSYPLIGAYTTAYARQWMLTVIRCAGERNVFYVDVDSVHVSADGYARLCAMNLVHSTVPGLLKVEKVAEVARYYGPKLYDMDDYSCRPGLSPAARPDAEGQLRQRHFMRLGALLSGVPPEGPVTEEVLSPQPQPRIDGVPGPDGWLDYPSLP
jgi:hypothetical protein